MNNNFRAVFVILTFLFLLSAIAGGYWFFFSVSECWNLDEASRNNCYVEVAPLKEFEIQSSIVCKKVDNLLERDRCFQNLAVGKQNPRWCGNIVLEGRLEECFTAVAVGSNNSEICGEIQTTAVKDACYTEIAKNRSDYTICKYVVDIEQKDACHLAIAQKKQDFSICANIEKSSRKDSCYNDLALSQQDPAACKLIEKSEFRDDCIFTLAQRKQDRSLCKDIGSALGRDICFNPESFGIEPATTLSQFQKGLSTRPSAQIRWDGDVLRRTEVKNDNGALLSWTFRDDTGAKVAAINARGEYVYRPIFFKNWKTVNLELFIGSHYQVVSNTLISPNYVPEGN